jgi:hypothetical protein
LKPIENLTQLKAVQAKITTPLENQAKENIAVDTSLSSWLVESEFTPTMSKNSSDSVGNSPSEKENSRRNVEDRPIVGALTGSELKQFSASTYPKWSRSRSPDEKVLIGTVGSYWRHTGQCMDLDSGSCIEMNNTRSRKRVVLQHSHPTHHILVGYWDTFRAYILYIIFFKLIINHMYDPYVNFCESYKFND